MNPWIPTVATLVALLALCATPAFAESPLAIDRPADAVRPEGPPVVDDGPAGDIGARLAALGQLRPLGEDFDLAVRGLFADAGARSFRRWRTLADTLAEAADGLPRHEIVIVALQPDRKRHASRRAVERARVFGDALIARGVAPARIRLETGPRSAEGIDLQIRFERSVAAERARVGR